MYIWKGTAIMNQNIFYMDCYKQDYKQGNIGFVRLEEQSVFLVIKGIGIKGTVNCIAYMIDDEGRKIKLTEILVKDGYGQEKCQWPEGKGKSECCAIFVPFGRNMYGSCVVRAIKKEIKNKADNAYQVQSSENYKSDFTECNNFEISEPIVELEEDKWEQLCKTYPQVHIFPEAESILIKPKDMIVLTRQYHELAANSFVLHSYYNYRQLLLFRYNENALDMGRIAYYIGVPGIYYEREKRIAMMFGFEGFENGESRMQEECKRAAYIGCFGYYMKQVDI